MLSRRIAFVGVILGVLAIGGCGDSYGSVSGKVTYKGNIVKGGIVTFAHLNGKPSETASINEDGSYSIPKVVTGEVKVCVDTSSLNPTLNKEARKHHKYGPPAGQSAPSGFETGVDLEAQAKRFTFIPDTYATADKTDLTYTVVVGEQKHDIEIK